MVAAFVAALVFATAHLALVAMAVVVTAGSLLGRPIAPGRAASLVLRRSGPLLVLFAVFVVIAALSLMLAGFVAAKAGHSWTGLIVLGLVMVVLWRLPLTVATVVLEGRGRSRRSPDPGDRRGQARAHVRALDGGRGRPATASRSLCVVARRTGQWGRAQLGPDHRDHHLWCRGRNPARDGSDGGRRGPVVAGRTFVCWFQGWGISRGPVRDTSQLGHLTVPRGRLGTAAAPCAHTAAGGADTSGAGRTRIFL